MPLPLVLMMLVESSWTILSRRGQRDLRHLLVSPLDLHDTVDPLGRHSQEFLVDPFIYYVGGLCCFNSLICSRHLSASP